MRKPMVFFFLAAFLFTACEALAYQVHDKKTFATIPSGETALQGIAKSMEEGNLPSAVKNFEMYCMVSGIADTLVKSGQFCSPKYQKRCVERVEGLKKNLNEAFERYFKSQESFFSSYGDYRADAEKLIRSNLVDPDSMKINFSGEPERTYFTSHTEDKPALHFGWKFSGQYNAKNQMGGYSGFAPFTCYIADGKVLECYFPESDTYVTYSE